MKRIVTVSIISLLCISLLAACGISADTGQATDENAVEPLASHSGADTIKTAIAENEDTENAVGQETEQAQTFLDYAVTEFAGLTTEQLRDKLPSDAIEMDTLDYMNDFVFPYTLYGVEGYIAVGTTTSEDAPDGITTGLTFTARGVGYDIFRAAAEEITADARASNVGFYHSQPYEVGGPQAADPEGLDEIGTPAEFDPMALDTPQSKTFYDGTGEVRIDSFNTRFGIRLTTEGCAEPHLDSFNAIAGTEYPVFIFSVDLFPQE